jgi:threonine aldolase
VSICLSKGLGAPVGSVLVGDAATMALAQRARKLYGGGMRQAGIIAAAGLYALEHNVARLADDARRARALAERLAALPGLEIDLARVQTNMVFAGTRGTGLPAAALVARLGEAGVLCLDEGPWTVRFVTHLDVDDGDIEQTVAVAECVLAAKA